MAYSVVDQYISQGGEVIDRGSDHSDAVKAAQERAKPGSAVGLRQTANVIFALDFEDASSYLSDVDVDAALAADLAKESDTEAIAELLQRPASKIQNDHQIEVLAKRPDHPFEHGGAHYSAGDAVVRFPDGSVKAFAAADFAKSFKPKSGKPQAEAKTRRRGGDS